MVIVGRILGEAVRVGDITGQDVVQARFDAGEQVHRIAPSGGGEDRRLLEGIDDVSVACVWIHGDELGDQAEPVPGPADPIHGGGGGSHVLSHGGLPSTGSVF